MFGIGASDQAHAPAYGAVGEVDWGCRLQSCTQHDLADARCGV